VSVRFDSRYIYNSVADMVQGFLDAYGWTGATPNFGTTAVTVERRAPDPSNLQSIVGNVAFISFGREGDHDAIELGGGMLRIEYVFFCDVIGVDESIGEVISSDLKGRFTGLLGGTRYLRPVDPGTGLELSGYLGEFAEVMRNQPSTASRNWFSVSGVCVMDFPGEES